MSTPLLITNARLLAAAPDQGTGWLRVEDGRIADLGSGAAPPPRGGEHLDAGGESLLPGFVDVHVHGALGREAIDADPDALRTMARHYARHGVTAFLPTTITAGREDLLAALEVIAASTGPVEDGATILGAHLEGPYLCAARKGAHREHLIRPAERDEAQAVLDTGAVRLVTLAPEIEGNGWLVDACRERGIVVSAGHTDASFEDLVAAADRGVTSVTHVFNGMRGVHHREPGAAGAALALDALRCELIADGVHVHPAMMNLVWRTKGAGGMLLVTDAGKATGMPDGRYERAGRTIVLEDGAVRLEDGTISGSVTMLDQGLRNFLRATGADLAQAWPVTSRTPATALGLDGRKGELAVGCDADLVLLDDGGEVTATIVGGRIVHRSPRV